MDPHETLQEAIDLGIILEGSDLHIKAAEISAEGIDPWVFELNTQPTNELNRIHSDPLSKRVTRAHARIATSKEADPWRIVLIGPTSRDVNEQARRAGHIA